MRDHDADGCAWMIGLVILMCVGVYSCQGKDKREREMQHLRDQAASAEAEAARANSRIDELESRLNIY